MSKQNQHSELVDAALRRWQTDLQIQGFATKDVDLVRAELRRLVEQFDAHQLFAAEVREVLRSQEMRIGPAARSYLTRALEALGASTPARES